MRKDMWDPEEIGPFDKCIKCFRPIKDEDAYAFCESCGKIGTVFSSYMGGRKKKCSTHKHTDAKGLCCLCGEPVCQECISKEHFSLTAGMELYYCIFCMKKAKEIEEEYDKATKEQNKCYMHRKNAKFKCVECSQLLCLDCSYYIRKGFLKKYFLGPFCLVCFRYKTLGSSRRWYCYDEIEKKESIRNEKK